MGLLSVIDDAPGYLKVTFQGAPGSGKTHTGSELACYTHKLFKSTKPIAFFDTEKGSDFVAKKIEISTGLKPVRLKSRGFSKLMEVLRECLAGASDILIIDSITHVWQELQAAYMQRVNENKTTPRTRMTIDDIMHVKEIWKPWPDLFITSPLHIIVCGREGNAWETQENEESGKRELIAVGKKMKVESDFGYEANLMISMRVEQEGDVLVKKKGSRTSKRSARDLINVATVIKDRFDEINGQVFRMPTPESFLPHLKLLDPSLHADMETGTTSTDSLPDLNGDAAWGLEKRARAILCEEIQSQMVLGWPGQAAVEKTVKLKLLKQAFGTMSWTKVESLNSDVLRQGLELVKKAVADKQAQSTEADQVKEATSA